MPRSCRPDRTRSRPTGIVRSAKPGESENPILSQALGKAPFASSRRLDCRCRDQRAANGDENAFGARLQLADEAFGYRSAFGINSPLFGKANHVPKDFVWILHHQHLQFHAEPLAPSRPTETAGFDRGNSSCALARTYSRSARRSTWERRSSRAAAMRSACCLSDGSHRKMMFACVVLVYTGYEQRIATSASRCSS